MTARARKLLKRLLLSFAALIVLVGLLLAAFGFIVGRVPEYRVQLQDWLNERTGMVVEFRHLSARLRLFGPELVFDEAVLRTPDRAGVLATARRGSVGFDIWNSIASGRLSAGRFSLDSPEIGLIRTREGRIQLVGQSALPERTDVEPFALDRLPTGRFHVEDAVVSFRDEITHRGPWSVSGVSFTLNRDPDSMQLRGYASLPRALGRKLEFRATAKGAIEESAALVSTFDVTGEELDLSGWADVFPDEWPAPETGHGSLHVRGVLRGSALTQLSAQVDFANVLAALPVWATRLPAALPLQPPGDDHEGEAQSVPPQLPPEPLETSAGPGANAPTPAPPAPPEMLSYARMAFALRARKLDDEWSVTLSNLDLARQESSWRAQDIEAKWSRDAHGRLKASGRADRLVLENLWPLLAYLPESGKLARLRALRASGAIEALAFEYERGADDEAMPVYSVQANIHGLSFKPVGEAPGLGGLSGALRASEQGGEWQLAAHDARFELPRLFNDALLAHVQGAIAWQQTAAGWVVGSKEIRVQNEDGRALARFEATIPADGGSPVLDLSARGEDLKVAATRKYLPAGRLRPKTLQWFERALVDGRVRTADFVYRGPTQSFPFRNDEGLFLVRGHVEDAVFDYQPGWRPASAVVADVEFRNEGMHIRSTAATVGALRASSATADIADLKDARLVIKAVAEGDLSEGLGFLKDSPIGPRLGDAFGRLNGEGAMRARVHLDLPIKRLAERNIEVTARLGDATLAMQNVDAPVRELTGTLTVRNTLITSAQLKGQWLGGAVELDVQPEGKSASLLSAEGHVTAAELRDLLGVPANVNLSGEADWRLAMALTSGADPQRKQALRIDSDLAGLGIGLPEPVGKKAAEARPLHLDLQFDGHRSLLARGSMGNLRSLVRLRRSAEGWRFDRGGARADGIAPALPDHRGLRIEGSIDRFVLDEWLALRGSGTTGQKLSDYLQAANVRIGVFELYGYRWPEVRGMLQASLGGWRVDVSGANATGQVLIPESFTGAQPLRATLDHLVLEKAKAAETATRPATVSDPRSLPNMQVYVADLRLGARKIGAVDLRASRVPQGIRFDRATVIGESVRGEGSGQWLQTSDGQHSSLNATVTSENVAATLSALNYTQFMQAERGEIRADLSWPGGFEGNILEHASGAISVNAEVGQLVNLQPGAGRVLGLFSVAALPRRLALDFSDLTEKGLAFDTVHGDFELRDGNAYTSNLLLRGPAAEIGIAGRTGLGARDYDQTAVVTGNLGASLPVAGALAGGPAVGAALLLFSQVFKEPLKGITRGYYRITGPWDEPVVERVDAKEKGES